MLLFEIFVILAVGLNGVVSQWGISGPSQYSCGTRLVTGLFTRPQLPLGYTLVATIPAGACRINVTELQHSNNYLALKVTNGTFVINGNFAISWSGEYEAAGTKFAYRRQGGTLVEAISAPGPLAHPIDIMILYRHPNPGIKYEYTTQVPADELNEKSANNEPEKTPEDPQTHQERDNAGTSKRDYSSARNTITEVGTRKKDESFPYGAGVLATESDKPVPPRHRRRKFVWRLTSYTPCSKPCAGMQTGVPACIREMNQAPVPERRCGPKPASMGTRPCGPACAPHWSPSSWSSCSATCGSSAVQTRTITCRQDLNYLSLNVKVSDLLCKDPQPSTIQRCQLSPCPEDEDDSDTDINSNEIKPNVRSRTFRERESVDRFSDSDQHKIATRFNNVSQSRQDHISNEIPEDPRSHSSEKGGYWKAGNAWIFSDWTQECSEECGKGVQTRSVRCADPSGCDEKLKPTDTRDCTSDRKCITHSAKWFSGPWSPCSNPCAINGKMTREVVCVSYYKGQHRVNPSGCPPHNKPDIERPCPPSMLRGDCPSEWFVSDWSPCSGPCGDTLQTRLVTCQSSSGSPDSSCTGTRPTNRRTCVPSHCHLMGITPSSRVDNDSDNIIEDSNNLSGDCVDRISTCHLAVQARLCQYKYYMTSCCAACRKAPIVT